MSMQGETTPASATPETVPVSHMHPHQYTSKLFHHEPHPHIPQKVTIAKAEQALTGFNMKIAVAITKGLGTMVCAYIFAILAIIGFPGFGATPTQYVQWLSQTFIQLVALSVLAVGQQVLSKHGELMADEQFNTTMSTYHDIEQIMQHLSAQDAELLRQAKMLIHLLEKNGISLQQVEAEVGNSSHLEAYTEKLSSNTSATSPPAEGEKQNL
jgi:hypothetical protein